MIQGLTLEMRDSAIWRGLVVELIRDSAIKFAVCSLDFVELKTCFAVR